MAAGRWNLFTYSTLFYAQLGPKHIEAKPDLNLCPWPEFIDRINRACADIQARFPTYIKRDTDIPLVAGTWSYDTHPARLGQSARSLRIKQTGDTRDRELEYLEYPEFTRRYDLSATTLDSGEPTAWTWSQTSQRNILIRPVPTIAGSIIMEVPLLSYISRMYYSPTASVTASATWESTTITISSGTPITNESIQQGDAIGLIYTTDPFGQTISNFPTPDNWTGIEAAPSGTTITINPPWARPTVSGLGFVTAEVWPGEFAMPGAFRDAPVWLALAEKMQTEDPAAADRFLMRAEQILSMVHLEDNSDQPAYRTGASSKGGIFQWLA